jgi:hypothetical protein
MKQLQNVLTKVLTKTGLKIGAIAVSGAIASFGNLNPAPVAAQAAYGSYVGIGGSLGLTEGVDDLGRAEDRENGVVVAARYKLLRVPISLRAQGIFGPDGTAVVPTISYDIPLTWQADVYVGAGGSFVSGNTPVGDQSSFAVQPGIDYSVPNSRLVVFGNAIFSFDAYENDDKTAVSLQGGLGLRF